MSNVSLPSRRRWFAMSVGALVVVVFWAMLYLGDDAAPARSLFRVASQFVPGAVMGGLAGWWVAGRGASR